MNLTLTTLKNVVILEPKVFNDERGFFMETYRKNWLNTSFVQDNHSRSSKGVLRGLHFQTQNAQGKLIRSIQGSIFDVVVDINSTSKTYGEWFGIELNCQNKKQLYIPAGYAHGFLVLSDTAEVVYKCTDYYNPKFEDSLIWNDPTVNINWNLNGINPIISSKDLNGKFLQDL